MNIDQVALTTLAGYGASFYVLMETLLKPAIKTLGNRYRERWLNRWFPVNAMSKESQVIADKNYTKFLGSIFRVMTVLGGIGFVLANDIGVDFFQVFGITEATKGDEIINVLVTGAAIGLGDRGTHFLMDMFEDVFRFIGRKAAGEGNKATNETV
jgi:hypothetical protein